MSNIFAELQMLSLRDDGISKFRKEMNELTAYMQSLPFQEEQIGYMARLRNLSVDILKNAGGFMVPDDVGIDIVPEQFRHDSYGFVQGTRLIYSGRFVFPVKDVHGDVAGFVGYDKFAPEVNEPKYLDSHNYGYLAKQAMFFGMENLPQYYEDGYVITVEGSMCAMYLRQCGFNALAHLGSYVSPYMACILNRFGYHCITIPDADGSGNHFKMSMHYACPKARVVQSLIAKDVDDSREVQDIREDIQGLISNRFYRPKYFK